MVMMRSIYRFTRTGIIERLNRNWCWASDNLFYSEAWGWRNPRWWMSDDRRSQKEPKANLEHFMIFIARKYRRTIPIRSISLKVYFVTTHEFGINFKTCWYQARWLFRHILGTFILDKTSRIRKRKKDENQVLVECTPRCTRTHIILSKFLRQQSIHRAISWGMIGQGSGDWLGQWMTTLLVRSWKRLQTVGSPAHWWPKMTGCIFWSVVNADFIFARSDGGCR